jgi:hypothetical protein
MRFRALLGVITQTDLLRAFRSMVAPDAHGKARSSA